MKATAELVKKYKRYHSTAVGFESSAATDRLLNYDPNISTFCGVIDVLKMVFGYFLGLLPYIHFERELAALPYMTRDYIKMKYEERKQATNQGKKFYLTFYIYLI